MTDADRGGQKVLAYVVEGIQGSVDWWTEVMEGDGGGLLG